MKAVSYIGSDLHIRQSLTKLLVSCIKGMPFCIKQVPFCIFGGSVPPSVVTVRVCRSEVPKLSSATIPNCNDVLCGDVLC